MQSKGNQKDDSFIWIMNLNLDLSLVKRICLRLCKAAFNRLGSCSGKIPTTTESKNIIYTNILLQDFII